MADARRPLVWGILAAALAVLVAWPLARLFAEGLSAGLAPLVSAVGSVGTEAVVNSLWVSAMVTLLAVAAALGLAMVTERGSGGGRAALRIFTLVPLLVPDFVSAISWARAYGPAGLSSRLLGIELPGLYGPLGIVLVLAVGAVPLAYLLLVAGMRVRADPDLERAARVSGASPVTAFASVTLPLLWPALAAAAGLVFVTTMNAFGTPAVLGRPAGFSTMTTRIYQDLAFSASDAAFLRVIALACLLVVLAVGIVAVSDRMASRPAERSGASVGQPLAGGRHVGWLLPAWLGVLLGIGIPLLALLLASATRAAGLAPVPENLTLDNFGRAFDAHAALALRNSVVLGIFAASFAVGLGLLGSLSTGPRGRARLASVVTLTFAVPGSVLAVAVLLAFGTSLRDTLALILLAYLAKLWALGLRPLAAARGRIPADLVRAARAHGASPMMAVRTVLVPLLAPVLVAAWLLVFVFALHEVTISILLYGPGTATLAVVILNLQQLGDPTLTTALAVLLTLFGAAAIALLLLLRRLAWPWFAPL